MIGVGYTWGPSKGQRLPAVLCTRQYLPAVRPGYVGHENQLYQISCRQLQEFFEKYKADLESRKHAAFDQNFRKGTETFRAGQRPFHRWTTTCTLYASTLDDKLSALPKLGDPDCFLGNQLVHHVSQEADSSKTSSHPRMVWLPEQALKFQGQ